MAFQVQTVSRIDAIDQRICPLTRPLMAFDPDPVVVDKAEPRGGLAMHEQAVLAGDLPQPGVLRAPGMVHVHRPLRQRMQRIRSVSTAASSNGAYQNGSGSK